MTIARSEALINVPHRKLFDALESTIRNCAVCSGKPDVRIDQNVCLQCRVMNKVLHRYAESNIPVKYWSLEMDHHFYGDPILKEKYEAVTVDVAKAYRDGVSLCFAGSHGLGKTMACCNILKRAAEKGYTCLYVNLNDIINVILGKESDEKAVARKELMVVDFLVIDEFDPRFMPSDKAADLFGKVLEEIFRTRHQNGLPIFMCTNSPNVVESFTGNIKASITSLMSAVTIVPCLGKDFRKELAKKGTTK